MSHKTFTPESANSTLPLVRRIVQDVVDTYARWQERTRELELIAVSRHADDYDDRRQVLETEVQAIAAEIGGFEEELHSLGIQLKDFSIGLVDFPSEINGRRVLLCWRLGEAAVEFWHEVDAGYSGRQPLTKRVA